ncbi:MAG TPA: class I SAM-dependent methyltransferase [Candidatus Bathyarchaeia archaeon]|nr:class I SAM-dependent methyltransferase [Candidatus Bathyarchaeia archaeon]
MYYSHKLSAIQLKRVYDIAPPRVRQYLDAEVGCVLEKIRPTDLVLELGCGYGRVLPNLAENARWVAGIDISAASLNFARGFLHGLSNISLSQMDAVSLGYRDQTFDCVVCIQNGISAFHADQRALIIESIRVTKLGGAVLFSSYSNKFWKDRIKWFELQSQAELLGEIDYEKTKDGIIVCKDGFTATTVGPQDFSRLTHDITADVQITEVDESSLFCEIVPKEHA